MTALQSAAGVNSGPTRGRASSAVGLALLFVALGAGAPPVYAQGTNADSARAAADSIARRLRRAEDAIALLQQQLAEQAAQGVTTKSRMKLELNGRLLVHVVHNDHDVNNADDPQFVLPTLTNVPTPLVMTARQSTLGAVLTASDVLGGRFTGDLDVDFYGGQLSGSGGRTFPLIRMRTARASVRWANGELLIGQETPLIAGLNPVSPAAIGTPLFAAAGNLWLWLPQLRGTIQTAGDVSVGLQAAVLANITGDNVGNFDTSVDDAEHSGRPAIETRVRLRWGESEQHSELGCGGHLGWLDAPSGDGTRTYGAACDARIFLTSAVELRGELFSGRGLRGLGGGGIGQLYNKAGRPVDDAGGWAQLGISATPMLNLGGGCGVDRARSSDLSASARLRNGSCQLYGIARPSGPLFFGLEVRGLQTQYVSRTFTNYHVSLATGFEF